MQVLSPTTFFFRVFVAVHHKTIKKAIFCNLQQRIMPLAITSFDFIQQKF